MSGTPNIELKELRQCEPGELVRFSWSPSLGFLALTANQEKRYAVTLYNDAGVFRPTVSGLGNDRSLVLSYGRDFIIDVDHDVAPSIGDFRLAEIPGALLLHNNSWLMPAIPATGMNYFGLVYLNLATGMFAAFEDRHYAVFSQWGVSIKAGDKTTERRLVSITV